MPGREATFENVAPDPSSMIESMRAAGYTLATAVADLIDNSIAASAVNVWLHFEWDPEDSWVQIADDGEGMTETVLRNAMRLGSQHPREDRPQHDLGRFGLGLKTASLSQCRRLTVASRTEEGEKHVRRWDLDHLARPEVTDWQLLQSAAAGSEARTEHAVAFSHGTVVLWEQLDKLVDVHGDHEETSRNHFFRQVEQVEQHLAMVFHRFLAGPRPRLKILLNRNLVRPWDPFIENHPATQMFPVDPISVPGTKGTVRVRGFVLPHKDRLGDEAHANASGPNGWNAQQGFYVYRNDRMILPASWLGLGKGRPWTKEEHYKLARLSLDIPNSMDHLWQLDVKKSTATPPAVFRDRLYSLATTVRTRAREVFAHRGKYGRQSTRHSMVRPWRAVRRDGIHSYRIDRRHPLIAGLLNAVGSDLQSELETMLKVIEATVPIQRIWLDTAEHPEAPAAPFEDIDDAKLRSVVEIAYFVMTNRAGFSHEKAISQMLDSEEFGDERAAAIINTLTR